MDLELVRKAELLESYADDEDSWEDPAVVAPGGTSSWGMDSGTGACPAASAAAHALDTDEEARDSWEDGLTSWEDAVDEVPVPAHMASAGVLAEEAGAGGSPGYSAEKGKGPDRSLDGVEVAAQELQGLTVEEGSSEASIPVLAIDGGQGRNGAMADDLSKEPGTAAEALEQDTLASWDSATVMSCDMPRVQSWVCAICHEGIRLADTAQIKACEHPYCANCILQWCSYKQYPWCPQCRQPFDSLCLFKMLDGSLSDAMIEESVCLLLRAPWFKPVEVPDEVEAEEEPGLDEEDYDEEEYYRSRLVVGNRRWGENGYVRGGRVQARVTVTQASGAGSSSGTPSPGGRRAPAGKHPAQNSSQGTGRRAKRAQKREQEDGDTEGSSRPGRQQPRESQPRAQAERPGARSGRVS